MKKLTIYCDVCGKQITGKVYKVFIGAQDADKIEDDPCYEEVEQENDFCEGCIDSVTQLITTFTSKPALDETEESKPVEEKPKKTKKPKEDKRKKTDAGKIWALHDAGWNTSSIAMEAQCSTQTVRNILAKDRPDMEVSNA